MTALTSQLLYPLSPTSIDGPGPGLWPVTNELAIPIYEQFVASLEQLLGLQRTPYDLWARSEALLGGTPCEGAPRLVRVG